MSNASLYASISMAFVSPDKRERFVDLARSRKRDSNGKLIIASRKKYAKFGSIMANFEYWVDERCENLLPSSGSRHEAAKSAFLKSGGTDRVYVMSEDEAIDGLWMELAEVLKHLANNQVYGTLIVNQGASLAYYEQCELASMTQLLAPLPST